MNNDRLDRVYRGGCRRGDALRVADRGRLIPSFRYDDLGFRLSRVVGPLEQLSEVADGHC